MARLLVKLHGQEISRLQMESGNEYSAGRAQDAHIQLSKERGISRHHLKFYERDGVWVCEALSKFMQIQHAGQASEVLELKDATMFSVPPYEFYFEPVEVQREERPRSENLPMAQNQTSQIPHPSPSEISAPRANSEATSAGLPATLIPYLRISYPNTADDEVLKLEGHLWVAGRDHTCEIPIDSPNVSRKHFELARTNEGFFITDLGSSNGTAHNGQRIPAHEPVKITSGDEIQVRNIAMVFEIRDMSFNQRLDALPAPPFDPGLASPPVPWEAPAYPEQYSAAYSGTQFPSLRNWVAIRPRHFSAIGARKLLVRGVLAIAVLVLIISQLLPDTPVKEPQHATGNTSLSFEKLSVEQRSVVKDSFNLARNLYVQGKYELCLTELAKLHEVIPQYENSKELMSFCEQGKELVQRQRDLEEKERKRQQIEQQIAGIAENCNLKLKDQGSVDETRQCLAEAMELDPEHHLIVEMIHTAQMHEEEKKFLDKQKQVEDQKAKRGVAHYNKAKELYKNGQLYQALEEYERFINTPYPHSNEIKDTARREVASIRREIKTSVGSLVGECKTLGAKSLFKKAYYACKKAVAEDPKNEVAKDSRDQMLAELKRELKSVYEDSVLEESMGNVDTAKEKWKKIMIDDIDGGDYANKAKSKLHKYGQGM